MVFAAWVTKSPSNVPEDVTGLPETVKIDGNARPTLSTDIMDFSVGFQRHESSMATI
jgi:hypothetical protein